MKIMTEFVIKNVTSNQCSESVLDLLVDGHLNTSHGVTIYMQFILPCDPPSCSSWLLAAQCFHLCYRVLMNVKCIAGV